jgi:hypothetical protein
MEFFENNVNNQEASAGLNKNGKGAQRISLTIRVQPNFRERHGNNVRVMPIPFAVSSVEIVL